MNPLLLPVVAVQGWRALATRDNCPVQWFLVGLHGAALRRIRYRRLHPSAEGYRPWAEVVAARVPR